VSKGRFTLTECRAKYLILRRLGIKHTMSDIDLCALIENRTGWQQLDTGQRARKAYMARYWVQGLGGKVVTSKDADLLSFKPKANRPQKKSKRTKPAPKYRDPFYESDAWRELRYKALKLHGAKCQCCGRAPKDGVVIHVDHIKPRSRFPELELVLANLQVLCADCNMGKRAWDTTDWRSGESLPENAQDHLDSIN